MKITEIKTLLHHYKSYRPLADTNFPYGQNKWTSLLLQIKTDERLTGTSVTMPPSEKMVHNLAQLLIGEDPRGVKGLWKKMVDFVFKSGCRGIAAEAIAGLDLALWDLKAKANNEPLYRTLGASSPKVKAYASDIGYSLTDDELRAFYEEMAGMGIYLGKLKVGLDMEEDLRRLKIMEKALSSKGKKAEIAIDSNEYWSVKEAIRRIKVIESEVNLIWAEEPASRYNAIGLKKVSDSVTAAVSSCENLKDVSEFVPILSIGAIDLVQVGMYTTGITGACHAAELAYAYDVPVSVMNSAGNFMGHLAASLPNHHMIEIVNARKDEEMGYSVDHRIEDGYLIMGDSPGLGISFNPGIMEEFNKQQATSKGFVMPGRREGAGRFVVPKGEAPEDEPFKR